MTRASRTLDAPLRWVGWSVAGLVAVVLALRILGIPNVPWAQNVLIIFQSLLVEALPFVLLGAAVSAAIEVFASPSLFARLGKLPRALQLPAAGVAGMAFPVCECGSVPVARRLASKGLSPGAAVTFMLAVPVVNPVVIAATYVAYRGRDVLWPMVLGRLGLGLVVAAGAGWVAGAIGSEAILKPVPSSQGHGQAPDEKPGRDPRWRRYADHLAEDVVFMGRYLLLGAFAAAVLQTFVPQRWFEVLTSVPILSLIAMMGLAFLLSLCSESDAFVAASFVQFGVGSQLAFLVFGPMMDLKLWALYAGTFRRGFVRTIAVAVAALTLVGTLWMEVVFG